MIRDKVERVDQIMRGMGFTSVEGGPLVSELRRLIGRKVAQGLRYRSPGTWAEGADLSDEARARSILAFEWAVAQGHSYRVECIDPPWGWTTNIETWKRTFRIRWQRIPAWLGDRYRGALCSLRVWWNRAVLRRTNPYVAHADTTERSVLARDDQ